MTERLTAGGQLRIAHRERADPFGSGEIPLEQRRGDSQGVGYVVEAVAQLVRRKERGRVHLKRQQIADGIAVFGAVQPVENRPARVGPQGGAAIQLRGQPADQAIERRLIGTRHPRRRHRAGADLSDDFLPQVGVG